MTIGTCEHNNWYDSCLECKSDQISRCNSWYHFLWWKTHKSEDYPIKFPGVETSYCWYECNKCKGMVGDMYLGQTISIKIPFRD